MPGFSSNSGGLDVVFANNVNFSGTADHPDSMLINGQLLIGSTILNAGGTHINVGTITSPDGSITIGYSTPNITAQVTTLVQPIVSNLGISQTSGTTFTVNSANGTALSATNLAYVTLQSLANPGRQITYTITANQSYTQANISGNTWGITSGVNWANDMPFYLYAVSNAANGENTIAFAISRIPNLTISPVAGKLAKQGSAVATTQGSMYLLPNVTVADYASSPCLCIGSFRMTYAAAGTTWTISTLNNSDGIGEFNESTAFTFPTGQNGNASGSFFTANGGTAPIWDMQTVGYYIERNGWTSYIFNSPSGAVITTAGVGAVALQPALHLAYKGNSLRDNLGFFESPGTAFLGNYLFNPTPGGIVSTGIKGVAQLVTDANIQNQDITGGVLLTLKMNYQCDLA